MSFVGGGARLTRARWSLYLTVGLIGLAVILLIAPLVGPGAHGHGVALMSPRAVWGDGIDATIFWHVRLPRTLAAALVVQATADFAEMSRMLRWMMGGLEWTQLATVARALPPLVLGAAVLIALGRDLNALAAGPEAAASVGVAVGRTQTLAFAAASLLVGTSIAIAGPIGFVGLIVPHALRATVGPDHRVLVPMSLLGGAALVVGCDTIARVLGQLPVGVVTALAGGPFFLALLVRGKRSSALWRSE